MASNTRTPSDNQPTRANLVGLKPNRQYAGAIVGGRTRYIEDIRPRHHAEPRQKSDKVVDSSIRPLPTNPTFKENIKPNNSVRKKRSKLQTATVLLAFGMILAGAYLSIVGWHNNHIAQVQAAKLTQQANNKAGQSQALSTKPPTPSEIQNYVVAPNLPRYLNIPSLGVHARVFAVGLDSSGALRTPDNIFDTDWYSESAQPGQPGAMLIDGHISSWTTHGVFYGLNSLTPGDALQIVRGDGTVFNYKVVKTQIYSSSDVDMTAAITPIVAGQPGLNLISCTGDVIPGTSQFNQRIIVFAEQVN